MDPFIGVIGSLLSAGILGAVVTLLVGMRGLALRRRTDTISTFMQVSARAHGYHDDGVTSVGAGQQVAAIYLVADLGTRDPWLRQSAAGQLAAQVASYDMKAGMDRRYRSTLDSEEAADWEAEERVRVAAKDALERLQGSKLESRARAAWLALRGALRVPGQSDRR
jgi:hypothetical protein